MTKGAGKIGARHRRAPRGIPRRRPRQRRKLRRTVLIVGEGRHTEPNYFDALKREDAVAGRFAVTVKKGSGRYPQRVVHEAVRYRDQAAARGEDFDEVWCVFDVEDPGNRPSLDQAVAAAEVESFYTILSNPCFEVWLLAHFERTARPFNSCAAVIRRLNTHWRKRCGRTYDKADEQVYEHVCERTEDALANAQWVRQTHHKHAENTADANSSTEMYQLVGHLLGWAPP